MLTNQSQMKPRAIENAARMVKMNHDTSGEARSVPKLSKLRTNPFTLEHAEKVTVRTE
jgi:hypothetical protein